jgi:hypothetical protein
MLNVMRGFYLEFYGYFYCHSIINIPVFGDMAYLEEYTEDSLNGGESTGNFVFARLGYQQCTEGSVDGVLYWDYKFKYPLFKPCSIQT